METRVHVAARPQQPQNAEQTAPESTVASGKHHHQAEGLFVSLPAEISPDR